MNIKTALARLLLKAAGFPAWNTVGGWPNGWLSAFSGGTDALELAPVYGCNRVLCQTVGSMPFNVYHEKKSGTREKATEHDLYPILHDSPNAYQTSMELREQMVLGFGIRGNGYAVPVRLGRRIVGVNGLRPDRMLPTYLPPKYDRLVYRYTHLDGTIEDYDPSEIIHFRNFSLDGLIGLSPLRRHMVEHGLAAQNYGLKFFLNSGRPSGVLQSDQSPPTNDKIAEKMRADWEAQFSAENQGKTAVLWKNLKYQPISVPPEEAQYIQTRGMTAADIAACYGVPLNMLAQSDKTATYASAEQFDLQFVKHTIRPMCVRLEQAMNKKLFADDHSFFCELDLDALLRGDSKAQAEYFGQLADHGIITSNESRRKLNWPESPDGDELRVNGAMTLLRLLGKTPAVVPPNTPPAKGAENHIHVVTPIAADQMREMRQVIEHVAALPKRKVITLLKAADGTTTGAEILEG